MFERIAKFRRQPRDESLETGHSTRRYAGQPVNLDEYRDLAAFSVLSRRRGAAVVHFLYRMLQDRALAEELAVEAFLRVYRSIAESSGHAAQSTTGLFRVATHLALMELPDKSQPPLAQPANDTEEARLAVACLPGKQRAAVLMHKYHQMDTGQIAMALDCPEPVAKSLLLAAYAQLRGRMAACEALRNCDYTTQ